MAAVLQESRVENLTCREQREWRRFGEGVSTQGLTPQVDAQTGKMDACLISAYVEHGYLCDAIDIAKPLHIIDLAPDSGARAWHVLNALEGMPSGVRYRAVCADPEAAATLTAHPFLQGHRATQRLEAVVWQGDTLNAADFGDLTGNPVVILAHGAFGRLRHDFFACHYGELLEAWVPQASPVVMPEASIDWRALAMDSAASAATRKLLAHYAATINSAALLVPSGALDCLQDLIDASGGRYLLLASDIGVSSASRIRLGAFMPTVDMLSARGSLPVNFDALAHWQQTLGAQVWTAGEGSTVCQVAVRDAACPAMQEGLLGLLKLRSPQALATQKLSELVVSLGDNLSAEYAFVLLRASDDSPQVFLTVSQLLVAAAPTLPGDALPQWRSALAHACEQYFPAQEDEGFLRMAASMAMGLEAWGLAARLFEQSMAIYGATAQDMVMLAHSQQARGHSARACAYLALACQEFPDDAGVRQAHQAISARMADWQGLPWYDDVLTGEVEGTSNSPLRLEPLGAEHAAAFLYQYRDPQIGMMARLPDFNTEAELVAWMAERRLETTRADFAVMHDEYGFAGVVSANTYERSAFFHFWMGVDFQDAGLGRQAARLLMAQLRATGTAYLLTAAYPDNVRSLRALTALGMQALDIAALPPEQHMCFYGFALEDGAHDVGSDLNDQLCHVLRCHSRQSDSVFQFGE